MNIAVIGAGHAGVEAAKTIREGGGAVTLFSAEPVVPYYRPRLVAVAFGQAESSAIQIKPASWYEQQDFALRLDQKILTVSPRERMVVSSSGVESYDGLIIANGGCPVLPPFVAGGGDFIWPLWSLEHAMEIRRRIRPGARLVVVGGGILGIEAALHAVEAGLVVTMVELMDRLMPAQFGSRASSALRCRLEAKGVRVLLGRRVAGAQARSSSVTLTLEQGDPLEAELCMVCIGAYPDKTLASSGGLACDRGILVDQFLKTSADRCYAAGDVTQLEGVTRCSMKEAAAQGKMAGGNLLADLVGRPRHVYQPETIPLTFRSKDFEIYSIGEVSADGSDEHLLDGSTETLIRAVITRHGQPVGVQMIGTRDGFDTYAAAIQKRHSA